MKNIPLEIPGPEGGLFMSGAGLLLQEWLRLHSGFEVKIVQYVQICTTYYLRFSKLFVVLLLHKKKVLRNIEFQPLLETKYYSFPRFHFIFLIVANCGYSAAGGRAGLTRYLGMYPARVQMQFFNCNQHLMHSLIPTRSTCCCTNEQ